MHHADAKTIPRPTLDYATPAPLPAGSRQRKIVVGLLLIVGVQAWLLFAGRSGGYWGRNDQILMLGLIAGLSFIPPVRRVVLAGIERSRRVTSVSARRVAVFVAIGSSIYLYADARYQGRTFTPKYHDEFSYITQARMLAGGRLWQPAHPCPDFFDSFQLIAEPVYASIYFPGAAMMYAPGVWLGLPHWTIPLLLAGVTVGLVFRIITELIDLPAGIIAALMMIANPIFRLQSLMAMSQIPSMVLTLTMFLAWLRWREKGALGWLLLIGVCAGWCAITRPLDALCAAIPIGAAMSMKIVQQRTRRREDTKDARSHEIRLASPSLRAFAPSRSLLFLLLGALPFLAVQLVFNRAVTGSVFQTPFNFYADKYFPQTSLGFHAFDPAIRPRSSLPQKQAYYDNVAMPQIRAHTPRELLTNWPDSRLRNAVVANVPSWLTIALMPAGLLAIFTDRRKALLWCVLPLFVLLYALYTFFLAHYPLVAAAAVVLNVIAGAYVVAETWPRARNTLTAFLVLALTALSISELAEFNRKQHDEWFEAPQLRRIDQALATQLEHKPALVLFRFAGEANAEEEPVYNINVVHPDLAQVIRAHDLGEVRNVELFDYYATRRPDLTVYRYDRSDDSLKYLGAVRDLSSSSRYNPATRPTTQNVR